MNILEQKNPAITQDPAKSVVNTFDLNAAAGPAKEATKLEVDDGMLASKQLDSILSKDNPLFQKARARAQAQAASRGLLNSSIAAGAGESAMIDAAMPLAQQDANTRLQAGQFNAGASNDFARDSNSFNRQGAMAKYGAAVGQEETGRKMEFDSFEAGKAREFQGGQNLLERSHQESMAKLTGQIQLDAEKYRVPMNMMGNFQASMQEYVGKIMADPNLDGPAKEQAIKNYYAYSQQTMGWMSTFFNQPMPNVMGGANVQPYPQGAVQGTGNPGAGVTAGSGTTPTITAPVDIGVPPPTYASPDRQIPDPAGGAVGSGLPVTGDQFERFDRWGANRL